jgi:hypothetical protein
MNLRSLKNDLIRNENNLRLAASTISLLRRAKSVDVQALGEATAIKKQIEERISELKKQIAKAEKNAQKKK